MCDCIQLGDYVCCPKNKQQDKCIEVGNYICCPRENHGGKQCENFQSCSNYKHCNSARNGGAATKVCDCTRSRSAEPQSQPRFVEEKFCNMIPPSFLCKNTDPSKPKARKPKANKKVKPKTDDPCAVPPSRANVHMHPAPGLMPGIYVPEGVTLAPQTPQANAEGAGVPLNTGQPEQQGTIPNPNSNIAGYTPGSYPIPGYAPANTIPGYVPQVPGYLPNVAPVPGIVVPALGYMPGATVYPGVPLGYGTNMPGYQYPGTVPYGASPMFPAQIPQAPAANQQSKIGGGQPEVPAPVEKQQHAAGLPSYRQPPFDPCTGEECNAEKCLIRRSKSNSPAPRPRNGLGVGFGPQRQHHPYYIEGPQQDSGRKTRVDCCQRNENSPPVFNCSCHCSLSSDLIERICKSLQVSCSCARNCCCCSCPKMNAAKKPSGSNSPVPKRKPRPSRSATSQLGKRDIQVEKNNNKLAGGSAFRSESISESTGSNSPTGATVTNIPSTAALAAGSESSPAASVPAKGATLGTWSCGCKEFCAMPVPPATRTCSCYANLMGRTDDSTQTPPPERNDVVSASVNLSEHGGACEQAPCCSAAGGAAGGGACCKAGCSSCCANSCCWPYYYYYDPCTGMYYCYRNCCYGCYNSCCNSCNTCCSTSCCQANVKGGGKASGNKSTNQDLKGKQTTSNHSGTSAANSPKRRENKSLPNRKSAESRNMGGDAMMSFHPDMQDLYEQWANFQQYIKQYPQAPLPTNPAANLAPGPITNPHGYYAAAISTPFYFASSYHNQMNMINNPPGNCCTTPLHSANGHADRQPETDIDWTPQ